VDKLKPKAVIFDLGSTLIDYLTNSWEEISNESSRAAFTHLVTNGHKINPVSELLIEFEVLKQGYRKRATESLREWTVIGVIEELFSNAGLADPGTLASEFHQIYYDLIAAHLYVYEDTIETLSWIRQGVEKIGLISNTILLEENHLVELNRFGISPFLDYKIFSSTFGLRKPHPDIFSKAVELAGFEPAECVYIGDRYVEDITGPASIGMPAILKRIPDRKYPEEMPVSTRQINNLADLKSHLDI
jgi:HAD superfamily hydrolase (TIGR01549 family)